MYNQDTITPNIDVEIIYEHNNIDCDIDGSSEMEIEVSNKSESDINDNIVSDRTTWSSQKISITKMSSAVTADRLSVPRIIGLSGSAAGEMYFDGTDDSYIYTSIDTLTNEELDALLI